MKLRRTVRAVKRRAGAGVSLRRDSWASASIGQFRVSRVRISVIRPCLAGCRPPGRQISRPGIGSHPLWLTKPPLLSRGSHESFPA